MTDAVHDVLTIKGGEVVSIAPGASLAEAVAMMEVLGVGALVVLEEDALCGMVRERDILLNIMHRALDPQSVTVDAIMQVSPPTVSPTTTIAEAMVLITERRCRYLPVISGRNVVGVVSVGDLLKWKLLDMEVRIGDVMERIATLEGERAVVNR